MCVCVCVGGVRKCVRACVCMNVHECVCVSGVGGRKSEWVIELFIIFVLLQIELRSATGS